jgi:hypothetical protein
MYRNVCNMYISLFNSALSLLVHLFLRVGLRQLGQWPQLGLLQKGQAVNSQCLGRCFFRGPALCCRTPFFFAGGFASLIGIFTTI